MSLKQLMAGLTLCLTSSHTLFAMTVCLDSIVGDGDAPSYRLDEVEVTVLRPVAKLKDDGVQVAVAGTYLANAGTARDVLAKMPFVIQAGSELEVLGKGVPQIYINGRQVRDWSELYQLASGDIKNVDVVTSPGARYDASVNAVIRITTKAPKGEGLSLTDRTTVGCKRYAYLFEQLNLNWRKNGFDLFGMLNYENYRERPGYFNSTALYLPSGTVNQHSQGRDFAKYPVYQGKIGLNYSHGSQYAGLYYDFSFRPAIIGSGALTVRQVDGRLVDELADVGVADRYNRQHVVSAYYSGTLGRWRVNANVDALWQINDRNSEESELSSINQPVSFTAVSEVENRLLAGNIRALTNVWGGELCVGAELGNIHRKDRYLTDVDYISDNDTEISETTVALFAEMARTLGNVSLTAGIRWECTDSRYYIFGERKEDQCRKYHNFAPSVSVSLPMGPLSAKLAYVRKTSRPAFEQLSSAVKYIDRYSYESGNPNLKPIYRDYISLTGEWQDIVVELGYNSTKNYFMWQTSSYPGSTDVTLIKMENMPRYNSLDVSINYSPCFFGMWRPVFMACLMAQDFKLRHNGLLMNLNRPMGIFRFNNAVRLPYELWMNVDMSARTSGNGDNFYVRSRWSCDLGVYKSFANDTWTLKLQLNDVFATDRQRLTSYDAISVMDIDKIRDTRDLTLTVRYNFNTVRSRFRGQGAANSEKDRF